ncbi:MAG: ATP-binding protein [Gammaproteobacteria bacterium]
MLTPPHSQPAVDLDACDREPIHHIGVVQPHGALLAAEIATRRVRCASLNLAGFTGLDARAALGRTLEEVLGADHCATLFARPLTPSHPELIKPWFATLRGNDGLERRVECYPHVHDDHLLLEFVREEPRPAAVWEQDLVRQRIIAEMIKPNTVAGLAEVGARMIREITGFDRVMIYRFAPDLHGEVIAESTSRADSFMGLHYPAADIPEPARRHFLLNLIRSIPDINAVPVPIVATDGGVADAASHRPLDLTYSKLRGVAPVHVEYLNNMGVCGSMSISLTANDALWGLVACHHYSPLHVPSSVMRFAELLGGTISALLQSLENSAQLSRGLRAERIAFDIESETRAGRPLRTVLEAFAPRMLDLVAGQGLRASLDGTLLEVGEAPRPAPDVEAFAPHFIDGVATSDHLAALLPTPPTRAAGAACLELSEDGQDYLLLLREHFEQTIKWAGRPEKVERRMADGVVRLSPRGSFEVWREERRGRSRPFDIADLEALRILRRALFALNSMERERKALAARKHAEAVEERLRLQLLDTMRANAMGELAAALAHELNQPLFAVSNYVKACRQELLNYGVAIPPRVMELIDDAATEAARAGELVRRLRNFIAHGEVTLEARDLNDVVSQAVALALVSGSDGEPQLRWHLARDLPAVQLDPVQIGQVVLNLVRNSLAALRGRATRSLEIVTRRRGDMAEVLVRDNGPGIPEAVRENIFEPFHNSTTGGMGIGLSLCRTILEAHRGRIWLGAPREGAEVIFALPMRGGHDARSP